MFGSKRRAKAKAEKVQAAKRLEDAKKQELKHLKGTDSIDPWGYAKVKEPIYPSTGYKYTVDPKTGMAQVEPTKFPASRYEGSWDTPKDSAEKEEKYWESTIEGSLDEENKFTIQFDGEADLANLNMIRSVLDLHINKLNNEQYRRDEETRTHEHKQALRRKEDEALHDKRLKESREHELKVIAAKKDAGVPLVKETPPSVGVNIPLSGTPPLNGSTGHGMGQSASEAYLQYQQMQSAMNRSKQYG